VRRPNSLSDAMQLCVDEALAKRRLNVPRIADLMGLENPWSLYKWIANGAMPMRLIRPFETACGCTYVTAHIAASTGKHVLVAVPTGRIGTASDIQALQEACTTACAAVIQFYRGGEADAAHTVASINAAIQRLACERGHVNTHAQPEFDYEQ
jgi:hypothetical protein